MFLVISHPVAILFCVVTMLGWGNTQRHRADRIGYPQQRTGASNLIWNTIFMRADNVTYAGYFHCAETPRDRDPGRSSQAPVGTGNLIAVMRAAYPLVLIGGATG